MISLATIEHESVEFIRQQLSRGRGLGQLLSQLDIDSGTVHAILPADAVKLAHEYANGAMRDAAQEHELVHALGTHLRTKYGISVEPDVLLLCQFPDGAVQRPDTGSIKQQPIHKTLWLEGAPRKEDNGELWYVDSQSDRSDIVKLLSDTLWFTAIGVVAKWREGEQVVDGNSLNYDDLRDLVKEPCAVLVGAWDEMNYLIWTPSGQACL
jgi:hypothetical protein